MPRQEGGHPAGVPCNVPPSSTSEKPSPQPGSIKKASPKDPLKNITNYRSTGWRKDLGHILRSFYHYNYPSHKEEEWKKLRTKFFKYLGQFQEEWRTIKEEKPLEYMPYMEHHFHTLTGVRLKGLSQFTGWIKPGSYYHGVVAKKGQLHLCLNLAGTTPPKGPQIRPSQSHPVTQKEEETPTTSPPMPGTESSATQGACSDPPMPMETGGVGDGQSWVEQAKASAKEEWRRDRPAKHHWSLSRKWEGWSTNPFPLQDSKGRYEAVEQLYQHAGECPLARHNVAAQGMACHHPDMESDVANSLNNQVLSMISNYHLTCLSQGPSYISPVLPGSKGFTASHRRVHGRRWFPGDLGLEGPREGQDPTGGCLASSPRHGCCWGWGSLLFSGGCLAWQGASVGVPPSRQVTSCLRRSFTGSWLRTGTR